MAEMRVVLNDELTERLRRIASARGIEPAEALERSVALYDYALNKADPNGPTLNVTVEGTPQKIEL